MDIQTLLKQNLGKDIYDASDKEIYDALLTMTQEMAAAKEHTSSKRNSITFQRSFSSANCSPII